MKKKMSNIIISICNLIGAIGIIIILTISCTDNVAINAKEIRDARYNIIINRAFFLAIVLMFANLIYAIQNRKNKKLMMWYLGAFITSVLFAISIGMQYCITNIFRTYV